MASEFYVSNSIVRVRLFGLVDGLDIMGIHGQTGFVSASREYKRIVYDYSEATKIDFTYDDAIKFAKLAALETQITPALVIGVIPMGESQLEVSKLYRDKANQAGAKVVIIEPANYRFYLTQLTPKVIQQLTFHFFKWQIFRQ